MRTLATIALSFAAGVFAAVLLGVGVWQLWAAGACLLAGLGWLIVNDVCALNKAPLTATVEIEKGDSVGQIASKLKKAGIITLLSFSMPEATPKIRMAAVTATAAKCQGMEPKSTARAEKKP